MSTMGCSFLALTFAALLVGFVPFLTWINWAVALPMAILAVIVSIGPARKISAQSADKAVFWISAGLVGLVILRMVAL